jgi:uncharacterized small protein (DUF1192 family)
MEDATITNQQLPPECELTTDDLAMMLGEAAMRERQAAKIQRFQVNQYQILRERCLKAESIAAGEQVTIDSLTANLDAATKSVTSLQARIAQLEDQVHRVALERDEAKKDCREAVASREAIRKEMAEIAPKKRAKES